MTRCDRMDVFVIGLEGPVGRLLVPRLRAGGDVVRGLVDSSQQQSRLARQGVHALLGELAGMSVAELAVAFGRSDAVVLATGPAADLDVTRTDGGDGVGKAIAAARLAGIDCFALVSLLAEPGRAARDEEDVEYYFAATHEADVALSRSDLSWLMLRPSRLTPAPWGGPVTTAPVPPRGEVRDDVATTLADLLHRPRVDGRTLDRSQDVAPPVTRATVCAP